jgi:hypothetical protein
MAAVAEAVPIGRGVHTASDVDTMDVLDLARALEAVDIPVCTRLRTSSPHRSSPPVPLRFGGGAYRGFSGCMLVAAVAAAAALSCGDRQ